jgi:RNA polymerase sigma-70 factor (ECF subfamily)
MPAERLVAAFTVRPSGDDGKTAAALRVGDERAFRALFYCYSPMMKRVAGRYVDSDAVAEEVVQETWLAVVTGIERFEGRSALGTWILSILIHQAKTHTARERRALPFSSFPQETEGEPALDTNCFQPGDEACPGYWAAPPRPWQNPDRRVLSLEARARLKEALAQLPERQRMILGLRDIEGLSAQEVCGLLELSKENQRVLLHRARSRLRSVLAGYFDGRGV